MKICPKCQKTYTDENLNFCLEDGTVLQQMAAAPPPTVAMNPPITQQPMQQAGSPQGAWQQPQQQYSMQTPKKSSKAWIWVLLILGIVVLGCGGGLAGLLYLGYQEQQKELANRSGTPTRNSPTPGRNSTPTTTTTSPSSRTNVDDLDLSQWVRAISPYGTTQFKDGELLVSSIGARSYYVITGNEDLKSTNADVSITVRNVDSKPVQIGYGLVFHSDPAKPLQQDYAFLLDTMKQKYRVARHVPGDEKDVINWTKSAAINSGSAENVLEIRDRPDTGKVDLYINGTLVNTIKNEFGYPGGVVGIYAGDAVSVAFKKFEIRTE